MKKWIKTFFNPAIKVNAGLQIRGIGVYEPMDIFMIDRMAGTGDCLLMCFHNESIIGSEAGEKICKPTKIILWPAGARQHYGNRSVHGMNWKHSWLHFDGKYAREFFKKLRIPACVPMDFFACDELENILREMHRELTVFHEPEMGILENLFKNLFLKVKRGLAQPEEEFIPLHLLKTRAYMDTNPDMPHSLETLAEMSGYSVPHFSSLFKKYFGISPITYANQLRMNHAAYLLHDRNLSISDISRRLGFNDLFHFSRRFKEYFGVSPRQMRG